MGQIVSSAAKPKRCNANQLNQVPTPAAGEHILVSSDNSMNAAGQGNFDCYIEGDGKNSLASFALKSLRNVIRIYDAINSDTKPSSMTSAGYWLNTSSYKLYAYDGTQSSKVVSWDVNALYVLNNQIFKYDGTTLTPIGEGCFDNVTLKICGIQYNDGAEISSKNRLATSPIYEPTFIQLPAGYIIFYAYWYNLDGSFNSAKAVSLRSYNCVPKLNTYMRIVINKTSGADFTESDIEVLRSPSRISEIEYALNEHIEDSSAELAVHTNLLVKNWGNADAIIVNTNRIRRTNGTWTATFATGFNFAKVDIPDGASLVRVNIRNTIAAPTYGYLPFYFSANTTANAEFLSAPIVCEVGEMFVFDKILLIPSGAKYIYVCTNLTGATGDVVYGDELAVDFNVLNGGESSESIIKEEYFKAPIYSYGLIDSDTGEVLPQSANYPYTIFDIEENWKYIRTYITAFTGNRGYGFVLEDGTWIGTKTTTNEYKDIAIPENAKTFKMCWQAIPSQTFIVGINISLQQGYDEAVNVVPFQFIPDFNLSRIPIQARITETKLLSDIYGRYDQFVEDYPNYVTRIDCSDADASLNLTRPSELTDIPIYIYKFAPNLTRSNNAAKGTVLPKAFIVTGVHSNEKMGIYTTYSLMKYICDTWKTDVNAEMLRTMCEIYVMPLMNPWGFIHAGETIEGVNIPGRTNYNGVNLNRNAPSSDWLFVANDSRGNYSGQEANSEYETKILMYYIEQISPDFFLDAHTMNMTAYGSFGAIEAPSDEIIRKVQLSTSRTGTTELIRSDENFPQDADISLIGAGGSSASGEIFTAVRQRTKKQAYLTEQCMEQKWKDGVLTTSVQSMNTDLIYTMNMKMTMNILLRGVKAATECR